VHDDAVRDDGVRALVVCAVRGERNRAIAGRYSQAEFVDESRKIGERLDVAGLP
jgi:hypothetical protein